jgi:hypothetical protein
MPVRATFALMISLCASLAFGEVRTADLDKAARLVFDQKYDVAARALEIASRQTNNRRESVLRILELQGVVYAQLNNEAKSKAAFQQLLAIDPKRELLGKYNAKVIKPFEQAQAWLADNPPIDMSAETAALDGQGKVVQIAVKVKNDTLKLGRKVRFNIRPEGLKWSELEVDIQGSYAAAGTDAEAIEWYAELLGERDAVLVQVGSQRTPFREGKGAPPKTDAKKDPEKKASGDEPGAKTGKPPVPDDEPDRKPEMVVKPPEPEGGGSAAMRGAGFAMIGVGVASLAAGTLFGLLAQSTRADVTRREGMTTEPSGPINGITQDEAQGLTQRGNLQALLADVFWSCGGGLLIAGSVVWFFGREVFVVPGGGGGIGLAGHF